MIQLTGVVDRVETSTSFTFYTADKKPGYVVIDAGDGESLLPTIPPFEIPVPGGKPVPFVSVQLDEGTQAICPEDDTGFTCSPDTDSGIILSILAGQVIADEMTMTTGEIEASADECKDFGTWTGSGAVGDETMTVIGVAKVSDSQSDVVDATNINGALIVAVIRLTRVEDKTSL